MDKLWVRIVLAIFVGMLLGYSVAVGPGLYQQWQGHRALLEGMATEPAYQVIDAVEGYNPRVTVLNALASNDGRFVTVWILHDTSGLAEEGYLEYLIDTLAHLYQAMVDAYPGRDAYAIIIAIPENVNTIEGVKVQIRGGLAYILDRIGVSRFLVEPTGDTLDILIASGQFIFEVVYQRGLFLAEILPREPGFIWPWDGEAGCNTCP